MLWQKTIITNLNQIIPNNYHVLLFTFLHIQGASGIDARFVTQI